MHACIDWWLMFPTLAGSSLWSHHHSGQTWRGHRVGLTPGSCSRSAEMGLQRQWLCRWFPHNLASSARDIIWKNNIEMINSYLDSTQHTYIACVTGAGVNSLPHCYGFKRGAHACLWVHLRVIPGQAPFIFLHWQECHLNSALKLASCLVNSFPCHFGFINANIQGSRFSWVNVLCFEICTPSLFSTCTLCGEGFKT